MSRTDVVWRDLAASPAKVYAALVDPEALTAWLPPAGMSARFHHFDARPGGGYRLVLRYGDERGAGKTTPDSDVVDASFVELVPATRVAQLVTFESDDPRFAGTMRVTWELRPTDRGTHVRVVAEDVPAGITPEDHQAGMSSSLDNLASYLGAVDDGT